MLPPDIVRGKFVPLQLAEYTGLVHSGSTSKWLKPKTVVTPVGIFWGGTVEEGYTFLVQSTTMIE
jgi:hypothetical protein